MNSGKPLPLNGNKHGWTRLRKSAASATSRNAPLTTLWSGGRSGFLYFSRTLVCDTEADKQERGTDMENVTNKDEVSKSEFIERLGCSHIWERRDKQPWCLPFYICTKCEMELSVDQYNCVQQAYLAGWDKCIRNTLELIKQQRNDQRFTPFEMRVKFADKISTVISAMTPPNMSLDLPVLRAGQGSC